MSAVAILMLTRLSELPPKWLFIYWPAAAATTFIALSLCSSSCNRARADAPRPGRD